VQELGGERPDELAAAVAAARGRPGLGHPGGGRPGGAPDPDALDPCNLYVGGLLPHVREDELRHMFGSCGEVSAPSYIRPPPLPLPQRARSPPLLCC
jgi:hypothetical protein